MRPSALHTSQVRCVVPEAAALRWWLSCHAFERDRDLDVGWVLHADVPVARESVDDLRLIAAVVEVHGERGTQRCQLLEQVVLFVARDEDRCILGARIATLDQTGDAEIGRASCRERVCQYVSISVVAVSLKKKNKT